MQVMLRHNALLLLGLFIWLQEHAYVSQFNLTANLAAVECLRWNQGMIALHRAAMYSAQLPHQLEAKKWCNLLNL
jgi:hypothetical protein